MRSTLPDYLLGLRSRSLPLIKFAAGGLLSMGTALGVSALLHELAGVRETWAAAAGLVAALTVNFFVLRHIVFGSTVVSVQRQLLGYLGSAGVFRGLEYLAFLMLNVVLRMEYRTALVVVLCASSLMKFVVYDKWIFARAGKRSDLQ